VWRRDGDADDDAYSAKELRRIFESFGGVEDVVIRDGKKKKGSAIVVFVDGDACAIAAEATCGRSSNPLVTARAAIPPKVVATNEVKSRADVASECASAIPEKRLSASKTPSVANLDFESAVLERLKRAQERARLVAEAEADES
jgi:DnaJ family protein C protein 17